MYVVHFNVGLNECNSKLVGENRTYDVNMHALHLRLHMQLPNAYPIFHL
jgi:hypothetical protein